jgi:hypothetical protein
VAIREPLAAPAAAPPAAPPAAPAAALAGADAFSLADPPAVTGILEAAGFAGVTFTDVDVHVYYGPDVAAALDWVRRFACTRDALSRLEPAAADFLPGAHCGMASSHHGQQTANVSAETCLS